MDGIYKYRISTGTWGFQNNTCEDSDGIHRIHLTKNHSSYLQYDDQYPIIPWIQPYLGERQQSGEVRSGSSMSSSSPWL